MQHHYRLHGLRISSEIELPELVAEAAWDNPDVRVRVEPLPELGGKPDELFADGEVAGFFIEGVAQYQVTEGREILVDPQLEAPARNVRLYLLGSALGLLLHQRGSLPLHANAIEVGERGYAFMGASGSGKSTLAAAFHDKGHHVIADDVCVVNFDENGCAVVDGGVPRLRLWEDALTASGRTPSDFQLSYAGDEQFRKFDVPTRGEGPSTVPLSAIIELASGKQLHCERLVGLEAVEAIFGHTYRGAFVAPAGGSKAHWQACMQLVSSIPVLRLTRPFVPSTNGQIVVTFESNAWSGMIDGHLATNN